MIVDIFVMSTNGNIVVAIPAHDRMRLERLLRYAGRPAPAALQPGSKTPKTLAKLWTPIFSATFSWHFRSVHR